MLINALKVIYNEFLRKHSSCWAESIKTSMEQNKTTINSGLADQGAVIGVADNKMWDSQKYKDPNCLKMQEHDYK